MDITIRMVMEARLMPSRYSTAAVTVSMYSPLIPVLYNLFRQIPVSLIFSF